MDGFKFWIVDGRGRPGADKARTMAMIELYKKGKTLQEIGDKYNLSRERIRQLLKKEGVKYDEGGQRLRTFLNATKKIAERQNRLAKKRRKWERLLGCPWEEAVALNNGNPLTWTGIMRGGNSKLPLSAFLNQRHNAQIRKIAWRMTFPEWWKIWQESGKWSQRGRGMKYGMGRYGDSGPYKVGNVYICTGAQNASDQYLVRKHHWSS